MISQISKGMRIWQFAEIGHSIFKGSEYIQCVESMVFNENASSPQFE